MVAAVGYPRFWQISQTNQGVIGKLVRGYIERNAKLIRNYWIKRDNYDRDSLSEQAKKDYLKDDSLHGFGDIDFAQRGHGQPLLKQQRALVGAALSFQSPKPKYPCCTVLGA